MSDSTVIVPLDGSELSEKAVPYARLVAKVAKASLLLVTVWEEGERALITSLPDMAESLMMEEFAGTRPLIRMLTEAMYERSPELQATDDPGQVVAAALPHRWAYRLGSPLKGELSPTNQERWRQVRPLVEKAWVAASSVEVDGIAQQIVKLLGLREHQVPE